MSEQKRLDRPPLLSDERIAEVYHTKAKPSLIDAKGVLYPDYEMAFCEAQRAADIKWYEEGRLDRPEK